jgi:hypothetical protein
VLITNNKYTLLLLLIMLILTKELIRASKVLKVFILRIIKPKKLASKID